MQVSQHVDVACTVCVLVAGMLQLQNFVKVSCFPTAVVGQCIANPDALPAFVQMYKESDSRGVPSVRQHIFNGTKLQTCGTSRC